jgi:hypothetical protein
MSRFVDWNAAAVVALELGAHTRRLVANRDPGAVGDWALHLVQQNGLSGQARCSYVELAALVGYDDERLPPGRVLGGSDDPDDIPFDDAV